MKIEKTTLQKALKAVTPGLASKDLIEQSMCFVFVDNRVFTYNDEVAVSHPIKINLEGAVPAKEFSALINKIKANEFELNIKENELLLKGSKAKAGLRLEKKILLPIDAIGEPEKWYELPETFIKGVNLCLFSASKNEAHAALTCIHIFDRFVESCDNHRITRYDMGKEASKAFLQDLLIRAVVAKDIALNEPIEYGITSGWLHFRNEEGVTFSCRHYEDMDYPEFDEFIEVEGEEFTFPAELHEVMDRASVMSEGDRVSLILENGELLVCSENQSGWFEEAIESDYEGESLEFDIQPEFMNSLLKFKGSVVVGESALRFDSDNFIHVVQIMSPKGKK